MAVFSQEQITDITGCLCSWFSSKFECKSLNWVIVAARWLWYPFSVPTTIKNGKVLSLLSYRVCPCKICWFLVWALVVLLTCDEGAPVECELLDFWGREAAHTYWSHNPRTLFPPTFCLQSVGLVFLWVLNITAQYSQHSIVQTDDSKINVYYVCTWKVNPSVKMKPYSRGLRHFTLYYCRFLQDPGIGAVTY